LLEKDTVNCNPQKDDPEQYCPGGESCRSVCTDWETTTSEVCACPAAEGPPAENVHLGDVLDDINDAKSDTHVEGDSVVEGAGSD